MNANFVLSFFTPDRFAPMFTIINYNLLIGAHPVKEKASIIYLAEP